MSPFPMVELALRTEAGLPMREAGALLYSAARRDTSATGSISMTAPPVFEIGT
jgi:hypothetical protein